MFNDEKTKQEYIERLKHQNRLADETYEMERARIFNSVRLSSKIRKFTSNPNQGKDQQLAYKI